MKDLKVDAKRDINDEKIQDIPQSVKGGIKDLDKDARNDGKTIDKEAKRVRRDKLCLEVGWPSSIVHSRVTSDRTCSFQGSFHPSQWPS